jgi:hypothetical protein
MAGGKSGTIGLSEHPVGSGKGVIPKATAAHAGPLGLQQHAKGGGKAAKKVLARLELIVTMPKTGFAIDAEANMPKVEAEARILGITPDPTSATDFTWTVHVSFDASHCSHGPARAIFHPKIVQTTKGGKFVVPFTEVRGGNLSIAVTANVSGRKLSAHSSGLKIVGTNPPINSIRAMLGHDVLRKMARLESGFRQFLAAADGGTSICPLFSGDNAGGVGILQITNPAPTADQVWSWKANVQRGMNMFNTNYANAGNRHTAVMATDHWKALVNHFNNHRKKHKLPAIKVTLAPLTSGDLDNNPQQKEMEAIRAFNGFGGGLHEFRVAIDHATGLLRVNIDPQTQEGTAGWERVDWHTRPQKFGDPNYVNDVLSQKP